MSVPTVTVNELSKGIEDNSGDETVKKVLEGILNDWMDLQYAKSTPYTMGEEVVPSRCTIEDVDSAISSDAEQKFKDIFKKISETQHSGDLSPQSPNDGTFDPKFKPVFVFVTPNP